MVPVVGDSDHVTAVLLVFVTDAVNCCDPPLPNEAVPGVTETATAGVSVMVELADLVASAALVAVRVTVCCVVMLDGAVYTPPVQTVPVMGDSDHVTAVLPVLVTEAVNCCDCPPPNEAVPGVTETATAGVSVMVALADLVASAALVAVMVTVCCVVMVEGAV